MKSYQAYTTEIDDLALAVAERKAQLADKPRLKNSCAIVFCGFEVDLAGLAEQLQAALQVPFIGCSAIGMLINQGYTESSISVLLLTADDCNFSTVMTPPLNSYDDLPAFRESYRQAKRTLKEQEKLVIAYIPWLNNVEHDEVVALLDEESGGTPVFGGVASDGWDLQDEAVLCNGRVSRTGGALLLISGNIRPLTSIKQSSTYVATEGYKKVTRAGKNTVYEFNDRPVTDYIKEKGLVLVDTSSGRPEYLSGAWDFLGTPFVTIQKTADGDEIEVMRCLSDVDFEHDCCHFIGAVGKGDEMKMVLISKDDIEFSANAAFSSMLAEIQESNNYQYCTMLLSSCAARYSLIAADKNIEGRAYAGKLPEGMNVAGAYLFGEFCPAKGKRYGRKYNVVSNESLTILAF